MVSDIEATQMIDDMVYEHQIGVAWTQGVTEGGSSGSGLFRNDSSLALTGMLSQAELVSAMPKTGGDYFYVMRSMGPGVAPSAAFSPGFPCLLRALSH